MLIQVVYRDMASRKQVSCRVRHKHDDFYAEKAREKERIWSMEPDRAQAEASMIPPVSKLVRLKSRAWI